eukprot:tig00000806_g4367.t1
MGAASSAIELAVKKTARAIYGHREIRLLMVGLDAAGKTTVLYKLKLGEVVTTIPTIGFNVETIESNNVSFTVWDVGTRERMRPLWRHYFQGTQAPAPPRPAPPCPPCPALPRPAPPRPR